MAFTPKHLDVLDIFFVSNNLYHKHLPLSLLLLASSFSRPLFSDRSKEADLFGGGIFWSMLVLTLSPELTAFPALSKISNMPLRDANRPKRESGGFKSPEKETSFTKVSSKDGDSWAFSIDCSEEVLFSKRFRMSSAVRRPSLALSADGAFVGLPVLLVCNGECNAM